MNWLIDLLFGCTHQDYSFPQSPRGKLRPLYVCCIDCGKRAEYDWQEMKPIWHPRKAKRVLLIEEMEGR